MSFPLSVQAVTNLGLSQEWSRVPLLVQSTVGTGNGAQRLYLA